MRRAKVPADLRGQLENARLEVVALARALDQLPIDPTTLAEELGILFELDADFAEALWGLDQPPGQLNVDAMVRDTLASLGELPGTIAAVTDAVPPSLTRSLTRRVRDIRTGLNPADAYLEVPGRDPGVG
jgi:hypothetical protein